MHQKIMKLIADKFRTKRGGVARLFKIHCAKCGQFVFLYQKDGPGILKRAYLDRINPGQSKYKIKTKFLVCNKCKDLLGAPCIYPREKRPAIEFFVGAVTRKRIKLSTLK
jgi:hypothetical protein